MQPPQFCPNSECKAHHEPPRSRWWVRDGFYSSTLHRRIQRFRCNLCGRGFSTQTFDIDYYAKRRVNYPRLVGLVGSCCGVRQMARYLGVGYETIGNKIMRFSRQALAVQTAVMDGLSMREDVCADGLQSYWISQYVPNNITVLAGSCSRFIYAATGSSLRRAGRMSAAQKLQRAVLERTFRADPKALTHAFAEICDVVCRAVEPSARRLTVLDTDEHTAYRRAVSSHGPWYQLSSAGRVVHRQTASALPRTAANPLAAINTIDRQIRIDLAEHVRETVRFARNPNRSMERFWVWCFHYNYHKRYRINQPTADATLHYQAAEITKQRVHTAQKDIWRSRRFRTRTALFGSHLVLWLRMLERPFSRGSDYLPGYLAA